MKQIVIVGGGSAGWLTAGIIAAEYQANGAPSLQITLVESPDVSTIGVGEGTWPSMRNTLKRIGLSEAEFILHCSASFKQGSKFVGWKNGQQSDFYYHPFTTPQGASETSLVAAWQSQYSNLPFADVVGIQSYLCENARAPKQVTTPEYAGVVNYGYHLDAGKFGELLQKHCTEKLGVKHILDHVTNVVSAQNGDIAALQTKESGLIAGDLFIDCSGLSCLLLGKHYDVAFVDQKEASINDCAMATQVPYLDESTVIESPTIATAQSAGWTWDIGLSSRRGVGYVYSSAHISDELAEQELRTYLAKSIGIKKAAEVSSRKLSIRAGHRKIFWYKNCVAVGMAAGFIEPLEASALAMIELSANMIRDEMPMTRECMDIVAQRFNTRFQYHWERIIDFLKLHYALTQRNDSSYWLDVSRAETVPESLRQLLQVWRYRPPHPNDLMHIEEVFPSASYQYVLYGMGFLPSPELPSKVSDNKELGLMGIKANIEKSRNYSSMLPSNRELICHIAK